MELDADGTLATLTSATRSDLNQARDAQQVRAILANTARALWEHDRVDLLDLLGVRHPAYDNSRDYLANCSTNLGPSLKEQPTTDRTWVVLGHEVDFPVGVSASVLTPNAQRIHYWANQGYNILTYKTVRNERRSPNDEPNWLEVNGFWDAEARRPVAITEPVSTAEVAAVQAVQMRWAEPHSRMSTVNSYGVPSASYREWQDDVRAAVAAVGARQLLIVSFVGDYETYHEAGELAADFARCARNVVDAGATAVEANLSCPNFTEPLTGNAMARICEDPDLMKRVVAAIREELSASEVKLVIKLGPMDSAAHRAALASVSDLIDGVAGINTLPVDVVDSAGKPLWTDRESRGGLSGFAIKTLARRFVTESALLRRELNASWDILGMGGVSSSDDFAALFGSGADAVQAATGVFANPLLAAECVERLGSSLPISAGYDTIYSAEQLGPRVLDQLTGETELVRLASKAGVPASALSANLPGLLADGSVVLRRDRLGRRLLRRA